MPGRQVYTCPRCIVIKSRGDQPPEQRRRLVDEPGNPVGDKHIFPRAGEVAPGGLQQGAQRQRLDRTIELCEQGQH